MLGVGEDLGGFAEQVLRAVAKQAAKGTVDGEHLTVRHADQRLANGDVVEKTTESRLALAQGFFSLRAPEELADTAV